MSRDCRAKTTYTNMNDSKGAESRETGIKLDNDKFIGIKTLSQDIGISYLPNTQEDSINRLLEWLLIVWKHDNPYQMR